MFPTNVTFEEYTKIRYNKDKYDDWLVGFVGFGCSFGGKFFEGYARGKDSKGNYRNYAQETYNNLNKQSQHLKNISFKCCDFREINTNIKDWVIYCDIPYRNTTKYKNSKPFPYDDFYNWCKEMNKNNIVFISEYDMPNDFKCIWEKKMNVMIDSNRNANDKKNERIERLFTL